MNRHELLLQYAPMADFIARMHGEGCEVLIHDVRDEAHSVLYITSPSLTGRRVGDGMTAYAVELIHSQRALTEHFVVNYVGGSEARKFRSSTYFIREGRELVGLLCVNVDIGDLLQARTAIDHALILDPALLARGQQESFQLEATAEGHIAAVCAKYAGERLLTTLPTGEKRRIALELKECGVFELKGKICQVAELLGVSEKTIYRYLNANCEK